VECGDGTVLVDGECVPTSTLSCGPGTTQQGDLCVADNPVTCGDGTTPVNGVCVVAHPIVCGDGTVEQNGVCVVAHPIVCGDGTVEQNGACVVAHPIVCGDGTVERNGACVVAHPIVCGDGTVEQNGACVVANPLVCGPGTTPVGGQCVIQNPIVCGPGTVTVGTTCVPDFTALCGPGTVLHQGVCVPAGTGTCGADHVSICVCTEGDDDNDGVCNDSDQCPGFDDKIDTNHDGVPDACDTQIDAFEPNDVTPYPQLYFPLQVFPILSGGTDLDKFSFTVDGGHMIVMQICAFITDANLQPPRVELRVGDQVVFTNANNPTSGCPTPILVPVPTRGNYVLTIQEQPQWNIARLLYSLVIEIT
jgi:hypothetical protein